MDVDDHMADVEEVMEDVEECGVTIQEVEDPIMEQVDVHIIDGEVLPVHIEEHTADVIGATKIAI